MPEQCKRAKELLVHWFEQLAAQSGMRWTWESVGEIEKAVDEIYQEAVNDAKGAFAEQMAQHLRDFHNVQ